MAVTFVADYSDPKMSSRFLTSLYRILNMYVENHSRVHCQFVTLTFNLKIYRYLSLLILHLFIKYESCMLESIQDNVSKLKY